MKTEIKRCFFIKAAALILLTATVIGVFAGCDKSEPSLSSPAEISARIMETGEFAELKKADEEALDIMLGIDEEKLAGYEVYLSVDAKLADEIAVFELSDENYRAALVNQLKQRLVHAASVARNYSPEQYDIIMKATVEEKGRFVFYIVNEKSASLTEEIKKLIAG